MPTMTTKQALCIVLPTGRRITLRSYCAAWRALKVIDPDKTIRDWDAFPTRAADILREMRRGIDDRINRHDPAFRRGHKWAEAWQRDVMRAAHDLNTPRLAIHWLPQHLRKRFAARLADVEA